MQLWAVGIVVLTCADVCCVRQEWCVHIENYLEAPRDGEAEQDDGPKGELDYWRNRSAPQTTPATPLTLMLSW